MRIIEIIQTMTRREEHDTFSLAQVSPDTQRSSRRRASGQGLVELALLAPIMIFMLMGTVDLARVFSAQIQVTNAAREGAYFGSRSSENASDSNAVVNAALADSPSIFGTAPTVTTDVEEDGVYDQVVVTVSYPFSTIVGFPGIPSEVDLSHTVRMRVLES